MPAGCHGRLGRGAGWRHVRGVARWRALTTLSERLGAVRNVFGNTTPTLYGLWDVRYLYRTDQ